MHVTRREFLQRSATVAASVGVASLIEPVTRGASAGTGTLPHRKLGRTGVEIAIIGVGLAPLGLGGYSSEEFEATANAAIGEGINYFDVQPDYGQAEKYFAPVLRRNRDRVFVVTKTWETTREKALASVTASLERLGIGRVDAVFLNNIGLYDLDQLFQRDGALAALKELRRRGKTRFIGLSGHMGTGHFIKTLETGEFDIVMAPFNFVDRHVYSFEKDILPVAEKHEVGVVAMKVLGGAVGLNYETRDQTARLESKDHEHAFRYVLGLPGMCSAVVGCKSQAEVHAAATAGRQYRPLTTNELTALEGQGRQLAEQWGRHYPED